MVKEELYQVAGAERVWGQSNNREGVTHMIFKTELLDALSMLAGCTYLSDLHALSVWQRARLAHEIERIPPGTADLKEWNDALAYLSREPPQETAEAARERLLHVLSRPR